MAARPFLASQNPAPPWDRLLRRERERHTHTHRGCLLILLSFNLEFYAYFPRYTVFWRFLLKRAVVFSYLIFSTGAVVLIIVID